MTQTTEASKIAIVTGASRGIGQAIAHQLAQAGYFVVGTATTAAGADKITEQFEAHQWQGRGLCCDISQPESVTACIETIQKEVGPPTILINNAAITRDNLAVRLSEEDWQAVIETNLTGTYRLIKACLKPMMKAKWGRIISISSIVGFTGNPGQINYSASKAGLIGLTKSLAHEVASRNITVNMIAPGFIQTDMTNVLAPDQQAALLQQVPLGRLGKPEDIANTVEFLVSDKANYITGETIHVNGGMAMI